MLSSIKTEIEYSLDIDSFKEISFDDYEKDFTFVVNKKKYHTPRIIADILSPKIRQYHLIDKTFNTFYIDIPSPDPKCDFSSILSLTTFEPKNFNQTELDYFRNVFFLLGNKKEFMKLTPKYEEDVSVENVFERINIIENYAKLRKLNKKNNKIKCKCEIDEIMVGNDAIRQEIDFISSHFTEIDASRVKKLNPSIIEDIISNTKLQLENEDSLLRFVMDIYQNDHSVSYLFERINFLNVSQKVFQRFTALIDYDDISLYIWNSINERIANSKIISEDNNNDNDVKAVVSRQENREISKPHSEGNEFNGIINYLTQETKSNIHENGTINVSTNSMSRSNHPKNLLNYNFNESCCYQSHGGCENAWVKFDFKTNLVKINYYSIKSCEYGRNGCHLKSWVLETSEDGINWEIVDERSNNPTLNAKGRVGSFKLPHQTDYVRYVRIRQTGEPWGGGNLWFRAIEFYGFIERS